MLNGLTLDYNQEKYIGICIKTNYDTYKFLIDDFHNCCERYGVDLINKNNKLIINNIYNDNKWNDRKEKIAKSNYLDGYSFVKIEYWS